MMLTLGVFLSCDQTFRGVDLCSVLIGVPSPQAIVLKTEAFIRKESGSGVYSQRGIGLGVSE